MWDPVLDYHPRDDEDDDESRDSEKEEYDAETRRNAENIRDDLRHNFSDQQRLNYARNFGENWANIIAGLGDQ